MTAATPIQPIVYGHDASGRPTAVDPSGTSPQVLIAGGTGRGLTTLAGVIAAGPARNGSAVRACLPRLEDDTWTRGVPGITAARGPEETVQMITETRDEMNRRLAALSDGAAPAAHPHALLVVDDYSYLAAAIGPRACDPVVDALAEIAAFGRAARVTLLVVARVLYGFPSWLLELFGTRIVLGPVSAAAALRLFGDEAACRGVPDVPGSGTAVTDGTCPAAIRVLAPGGQE
jgi:hypothetical protein